MTNESSLDILRSLKADAILGEVQRQGRPYGRSPIIAFTDGYVAAMRTEDRPNRFKQVVPQLGIDITGAKVIRATTPQSSGDFTLWVELPLIRSGDKQGELSEQPGYELNQILLSMRAVNEQCQTILDLRGRTIDAAEAVYENKYQKFEVNPSGGKERTNRETKELERGDYVEATNEIYYYKVSKIVGSGQTGQVEAKPSVEAMKMVTGYVKAQLSSPETEASLLDTKVTRMALQAAGVDFSLNENAGILEAVLNGTLPELCGLAVAV